MKNKTINEIYEEEYIKKLKRDKIFMLIIIITLGIGGIIISIQRAKELIVYAEAKEEFGEFMLFQIEMLEFCINQTDYTLDNFTDDFIRYKTEEILKNET